MRSARLVALGLTLLALCATLPSCLLGYADDLALPVELRARRSNLGADGATGVTVEAGWIHIREVELVPCATQPPARASLEAVRRAILPRAAAHHPSALTLRPEAPATLGERAAGLGMLLSDAAACAVRLLIGGARDDAFELRGRWRGGEHGEGSFRARGIGARVIELPLVDEEGDAMTVSPASTEASAIALELDAAALVAAQADLTVSPEDLGLDLMVDLHHHLRARVVSAR